LSRREAYKLICRMAEREYADIVQKANFDEESVRIYLTDARAPCRTFKIGL
jgi:hypothetical protein